MRPSATSAILTLAIAILASGQFSAQTPRPANASVTGVVKSSSGAVLEGMTVSARAAESTITTSVYTNGRGEYSFPQLEAGQYSIWAQAVGFALAQASQTVSAGQGVQQNFTMQPFADVHKQLSSAEWTESLPDATVEDRRLRHTFFNTCTGCHSTSEILKKRFDAAGWELIIPRMFMQAHREDYRHAVDGRPPQFDANGEQMGAARMILESYKDEMVSYLARVRGPTSPPLKYKVFPRPSGAGTEVVVTEYDVPLGDQFDDHPEYRGSDWSRHSRLGGGPHDLMYSVADGNLYFTVTDNRGTTGQLNPKTGHIRYFQTPGVDRQAGRPASSSFGDVDKEGNIWLINTNTMIAKFDPRTSEFQRFVPPAADHWHFHGGGNKDAVGNVWISEQRGAARLNSNTGEFAIIPSLTKNGRPYDLVLDSRNNPWYTMIGVDRLATVDARTGKVTEVDLPPTDEEFSTIRDREIGRRAGAWANGAPNYHKGPRRLAADPTGDTVWFGEDRAGRIGKIDINTKKITEYKLPFRFALPYKLAVGRNHIVYFGMSDADQFGTFDPSTEQFTFYQLPSRGTSSRHIYLDESTGEPILWMAFQGVNKVARIQFRTRPGR